MHNYYGYGYGFGPIEAIIHILFWILVIGLIIRLIRGPRWRGGYFHRHWHEEKDAIDLLKERYAKGEINKQEFEEKKKDLEK